MQFHCSAHNFWYLLHFLLSITLPHSTQYLSAAQYFVLLILSEHSINFRVMHNHFYWTKKHKYATSFSYLRQKLQQWIWVTGSRRTVVPQNCATVEQEPNRLATETERNKKIRLSNGFWNCNVVYNNAIRWPVIFVYCCLWFSRNKFLFKCKCFQSNKHVLGEVEQLWYCLNVVRLFSLFSNTSFLFSSSNFVAVLFT